MKIVLAAVNAKYIHANLAVYSLRAYAKDYRDRISIKEYTINQYTEEILADLYKEQADMIAFSCYIWNIEMIEELVWQLHQLKPQMPIWLGGPEVSYDAIDCLQHNPGVTGIMRGEGEDIFRALCRYYVDGTVDISQIQGIVYRDGKTIVDNGWNTYMDINDVPFVYEDMHDFENKIVYYETSRGCPFACSYCLSSIDKRVRLRNMDLVKKELQFFLDQKVPQVKFVDRTFNCNKQHAMEIWSYIKAHDQGITNFHFEIGADLLDDDQIRILSDMRPGLVQLEIGVQSTNDVTIREVARTMKLDKLADAVHRINNCHNIHQHLDLIAGLPYEDYERFKQSFNEVFAMEPEQLQLGFLKVLKGSVMHEKAGEYGIIYKNKAPYEVMKTKWMCFDDILRLKGVEEMVEVYYNSHQFENTITYLIHQFSSPFDCFEQLADYYEEHQLGRIQKGRMQRYDILLDFAMEHQLDKDDILKELMIFDLYARENLKSRPSWAPDMSAYRTVCEAFYMDSQKTERYLPSYKAYTGRQMRKMTHMEYFSMNVQESAEKGSRCGKTQMLLFDYQERNPLTYAARIVEVQDEDRQGEQDA